MPLQLLTPPLLVSVRGPDGRLCQALLLGRREDRRFVQVSSGPGDNRLRWVSRDAVLEPRWSRISPGAVPPPFVD